MRLILGGWPESHVFPFARAAVSSGGELGLSTSACHSSFPCSTLGEQCGDETAGYVREKLPDFQMGRRFCRVVSEMGNFMLPQEARQICFHCFCPCRLYVRVAALVSIHLVTYCFAIPEDRSHNEKA